MALMARSGVESLRTVFSWRDIQPPENGPFDFARTDAQVARRGAPRHRRAAGDAVRAQPGAARSPATAARRR